MASVTRNWTNEELESDSVSKKEILTFLQENAAQQFQVDHKLKGKNAGKTKTKKQLCDDYNLLFETKSFKVEGEAELVAATKDLSIKKESSKEDSKDKVAEPKYTKKVLKKGDKVNYAHKGDTVEIFYTGKLPDGTVFDSNIEGLKRGKKPQALQFKVGNGSVVRGLDEALLTMSAGEKLELVIESEWAYGKKGLERGKNEISIPPSTPLTFIVELYRIF